MIAFPSFPFQWKLLLEKSSEKFFQVSKPCTRPKIWSPNLSAECNRTHSAWWGLVLQLGPWDSWDQFTKAGFGRSYQSPSMPFTYCKTIHLIFTSFSSNPLLWVVLNFCMCFKYIGFARSENKQHWGVFPSDFDTFSAALLALADHK